MPVTDLSGREAQCRLQQHLAVPCPPGEKMARQILERPLSAFAMCLERFSPPFLPHLEGFSRNSFEHRSAPTTTKMASDELVDMTPGKKLSDRFFVKGLGASNQKNGPLL